MSWNGSKAHDTEFVVSKSRKGAGKGRRRVYVGNLPNGPDVALKLQKVFREAGLEVPANHMEVKKTSKSAFALVSMDKDADRAVSDLQGTMMDGKKLVIQHEKKKKSNSGGRQQSNSKKPSSSFGGGWMGPAADNDNHDNNSKPTLSSQERQQLMDPSLELSSNIKEIVSSQVETSDDPVGTALAATAAMSLLSSVDAFGLNGDNEAAAATLAAAATTQEVDEPKPDFAKSTMKPLSELLEDYGEQDLDFRKMVVTGDAEKPQSLDKPVVEEKKKKSTQSRLGQHGKAPIHVVFTSFGYVHGAPSTTGWSHAQPLPPLDCRGLPEVLDYLARRHDGKSPAVKRVVQQSEGCDGTVEALSNRVWDALREAIADGGHGHALPLRMTVTVGSETGRHRSVVVAETAATRLRQRLRTNPNNQISQPVSVGTLHRDIERRTTAHETRTARSKQNELEDRW